MSPSELYKPRDRLKSEYPQRRLASLHRDAILNLTILFLAAKKQDNGHGPKRQC